MAGGLDRVLPRARRIGAEAVQIFPSNPRQWRRPILDRAALAQFGRSLGEARLPLFIHTIYLINLAAPDPALRGRSAEALADALVFGALAEAAGVVTHVGSHRGEGFQRACAWVAGAAGRALDVAAGRVAETGLPPLLLESGAGGRGTVGGSTEELAELLAVLPDGTGVCLDTAHLFAAGYPVHRAAGLDHYFDGFARAVGTERIGLVHLNDSRSELGSRRDRHENLGEGQLGRSGLSLWLQHPQLRRVAFVLETPGFDGAGPDLRNIRRARRMRAGGNRSRTGG